MTEDTRPTFRDALATAYMWFHEVDPCEHVAWGTNDSPNDIADVMCADPAFREALTHAIGEAMTWVEDDKIAAHPECLTDTCGHDECPDWSALGCGDAAAVVGYLLTPVR